LLNERTEHFADPQAVARYAEGPPRIVPGFAHLQRMTTLLLAERVPRDGRVLVLGAGAAELPIFAPAQEEAILREGGFSDVSLFYVGLAFRGWVAYAKHP
jgi:hypothetical protein